MPADQAHRGHERTRGPARQMVQRAGVEHELVPHGGKAAVLDGGHHVARQRCLAGRHHHRRAAHRIAVQQDACLRIRRRDHADPVHQVHTFHPPHADVAPLAQLVPARGGHQHRESHPGVPVRVLGHLCRVAAVSVAADRVQVRSGAHAIGVDEPAVQLEPVAAHHRDRLLGLLEPVGRLLLLRHVGRRRLRLRILQLAVLQAAHHRPPGLGVQGEREEEIRRGV